jgi:hypothetical protein
MKKVFFKDKGESIDFYDRGGYKKEENGKVSLKSWAQKKL